MFEHLWLLLLPLAAASGWYAAKKSSRRKDEDCSPMLASQYVKGLNFLLNEQTDKALEVFIQMVEVDRDTVETHLVLGSLFRRRGEVDRAIRIHQNLIARPSLDSSQKATALLELGKDYLKAGWLDRAESLFKELIHSGRLRAEVYGHLRELYEQEREWSKAIEAAEQLQDATGESQGAVIAHYYCELAEIARKERDLPRSITAAKRALYHDRDCVRASTLLGDLAYGRADYKGAIKHYRRVLTQNPMFLSLVVPKLKDAYLKCNDAKGFIVFLRKIKHQHQSVPSFLALVESLLQEGRDEEARELLELELSRDDAPMPVIQQYLALAERRIGGDAAPAFARVKGALTGHVREQISHQCTQCGFEAKALLWQCPGCHGWGTVRPLDRLEYQLGHDASRISVI